MTNLVSAYQNNDINEFELILKHNRQTIMEDLFIREHIEDLLRNIRTQVRIAAYIFQNSSLSVSFMYLDSMRFVNRENVGEKFRSRYVFSSQFI